MNSSSLWESATTIYSYKGHIVKKITISDQREIKIDLQISMAEKIVLTGTVFDGETMEPVVGAILEEVSRDFSKFDEWRATTTQDGSFEIVKDSRFHVRNRESKSFLGDAQIHSTTHDRPRNTSVTPGYESSSSTRLATLSVSFSSLRRLAQRVALFIFVLLRISPGRRGPINHRGHPAATVDARLTGLENGMASSYRSAQFGSCLEDGFDLCDGSY